MSSDESASEHGVRDDDVAFKPNPRPVVRCDHGGLDSTDRVDARGEGVRPPQRRRPLASHTWPTWRGLPSRHPRTLSPHQHSVAVAILDAAVVGSAHERSALAIQSRQHFNAPDVEPSRLLLLVHASARPRRQPLDTRPRQRLDHLPVAATTMFAAVLVALAVTIGCDCAHRTAGRSLHEINPG